MSSNKIIQSELPHNKVHHVEDSSIANELDTKDLIDDSTDIIDVCKNGNLDLLKVLVERGDSVQKEDAFGHNCLMIACKNGHLDIVKYLLDRTKAQDKDNNDAVKVRDIYGCTCMLIACGNGHLDVVKYLLENGSDINEKSDYGSTGFY